MPACPYCAEPISKSVAVCPYCQSDLRQRRPTTSRGKSNTADDAGMRMLLPVGRSGWAIAAGYLGLFSTLFVFAPISLIVSIIAIRDLRKNPKRYGYGRAIFGLVMGALFTIFLVVGIVVIVNDVK